MADIVDAFVEQRAEEVIAERALVAELALAGRAAGRAYATPWTLIDDLDDPTQYTFIALTAVPLGSGAAVRFGLEQAADAAGAAGIEWTRLDPLPGRVDGEPLLQRVFMSELPALADGRRYVRIVAEVSHDAATCMAWLTRPAALLMPPASA